MPPANTHEHVEPRSHAPDETGGRLLIDLREIVKNYRIISSSASPSSCAAVLKADAYGLGAKNVVAALYKAGCREFFVAHLCEALALRPHVSADASIMVLNGVTTDAMKTALNNSITPVLNTLEQALSWTRLLQSQDAHHPVVLQIDTGMTRLGLTESEVHEFSLVTKKENLKKVDLLMSHMASADVPDDAYCAEQRQQLLDASQHFPIARLSLANSAGCFMGPDYTLDLCRPGAALFGIQVSPRSVKMSAVVYLDLKVAQIRSVPAGVTVGYGRTYTTPRASRIATISAGYADGVPRSLGAPAGVWFGTHKMPIVGRVCMDSFMVDATDVIDENFREGGWVEFLGPNQSLDDIGSASGTIGYEILTRLGPRYSKTVAPFA